MLGPVVILTDLASVLLVIAAAAPAPRHTRAYLLIASALFAVGTGLSGLTFALGCAVLALTIDGLRLLELQRMMDTIASELTNERSLGVLRPYMSPRAFKGGETIFTRGDVATHLFYLIEGTVTIPEINERVRPGQLFGEIALFTRERRRTLGARADTDVSSLAMSAEDLISVVRSNPRIGFYFIGLITQRLTHDFSYLSELFWSAESERRHLFELATRDGLTGVANRRSFDERLSVEWAHASRSKRPISLVILDIDHFKEYNDTFGHAEGDVALKSVAHAMSRCVMRRSDLFARYGGEEFGAILAGTNHEGTMRIAEAMRAAVAALGMKHPHNDSGLLTVSAGAATLYPSHDMTAATLVQTADEALYRAKSNGRNRVEGTVVGEAAGGEDEQRIA